MVKGGHADPYAAYGSGSKREQPTLSPVDGNGGGGDINDEGDFSSGADSPAPDSSSSDEEDIGDKDQGQCSDRILVSEEYVEGTKGTPRMTD